MIDVDDRARRAAAGLRTAVDHFDVVGALDLSAPKRPTTRVRLVLVGIAAVTLVVLMLGLVVATRSPNGATPAKPPAAELEKPADVGGYPVEVTVDARGAFVANQRAEVVRLDPGTGAIATRVPTERPVIGVATDSELGIWAFGGGDGADTSGDVVFLGPTTDRPPSTFHLTSGAVDMAFAAGRVWMLDTDGMLSAHDPITFAATFSQRVASADTSISLTNAGRRLWVATPHSLTRFDPHAPATPGPVRAVRSTLMGIASDGHHLWTSVCRAPELCFLERRDLRTGKLLERFDRRLLASRDGGPQNLVAADGAVWMIGAAGPTLLRTTPAGEIERVMSIPAALRSRPPLQYRYFGIGEGALWWSVAERGRIYRVALP